MISEEESIFNALSKTMELLQGNTAPIRQYYYGCLFNELLAFQLPDRHPPAEVCTNFTTETILGKCILFTLLCIICVTSSEDQNQLKIRTREVSKMLYHDINA